MSGSLASGGREGIISIGTERPREPSDASFALVIDFQRGTSNPGRVFQAADAMIRALQALDHTLCDAVDSQIEPIMLLEDIEAGSIKAWLGNQLSRVDDDGLKKLDWKPIVGKYLVRAKYAVIRWSNKEGGEGGLIGLSKELKLIAQETDIRHLPDYAPPPLQELSAAAKTIDEAKALLGPNDKMRLESPESGVVEFNLAVKWSPDELSELAVKETTASEIPMTLIVKKPDYLGRSKWEFRWGKKSLSAKIEDEVWLESFQTRKVDIRPGDALRCKVRAEYKYGYDNELIAEEYSILKVEGVSENQLRQDELPL